MIIQYPLHMKTFYYLVAILLTVGYPNSPAITSPPIFIESIKIELGYYKWFFLHYNHLNKSLNAKLIGLRHNSNQYTAT